MLTPEDLLLMHLIWYKHAGEVADDQWNDILGLLKIQSPTLDIEYPQESAQLINVSEPLGKALADAGLSGMSSETAQEG